MNLIFDNESSPEFVVEESINESTGKTDKKYKIKGVFSTIGEKNRNGRIYPRNLWETEISKYQNNFESGSIDTLMEYEHPARSQVDPMEAVAKITSLRIKDRFVMGEAVLLDNPKANQLKTLIENNVKMSVSSRGVGSVKNGIVENFKLVTYDIVAQPSDYNASMHGLVEGYQLNEGIVEGISFELDDFGNLVQSTKDKLINECSEDIFHQNQINEAIIDKFEQMLEEL